MRDFEVIRDPLWDNIRLDGTAVALLDTAPMQRLRYIRQLGHAFLGQKSRQENVRVRQI